MKNFKNKKNLITKSILLCSLMGVVMIFGSMNSISAWIPGFFEGDFDVNCSLQSDPYDMVYGTTMTITWTATNIEFCDPDNVIVSIDGQIILDKNWDSIDNDIPVSINDEYDFDEDGDLYIVVVFYADEWGSFDSVQRSDSLTINFIGDPYEHPNSRFPLYYEIDWGFENSGTIGDLTSNNGDCLSFKSRIEVVRRDLDVRFYFDEQYATQIHLDLEGEWVLDTIETMDGGTMNRVYLEIHHTDSSWYFIELDADGDTHHYFSITEADGLDTSKPISYITFDASKILYAPSGNYEFFDYFKLVY